MVFRILLSSLAISLIAGCSRENPEDPSKGTSLSSKPVLIGTLPKPGNTPDGCTLDAAGNIILSVPNFNNTVLKEKGLIEEEAPALMLSISPDNTFSTWYTFKREDLHPDTGKVGPMDCAFGPDGHLYVADNQLFYNGEHKSRLLRINVQDGKAVDCEVVVEGFIVSNGVVWEGDTIYVSETVLIHPEEVEEGQAKPKLISGVYAISIDDWKEGPVQLKPYSAEEQDPRLIAVYTTSNRIGFGADGVVFDDEGNFYCGIFEDGIVYKTTFDAEGKPSEPVMFAQDPAMACCDGMIFRPADRKIYVADMLVNAVQAVDMSGAVETIHRNGNTDGADGSLDQPCEVLLRGDELIVVSMDMPWESDLLTNTEIDEPYTVSAIPLN